MTPLFGQQFMGNDPMPPMPTLNIPPPQQGGGMFGGGGKFGIGQALVAALNGYLASTRGPAQQVGANNLQMMAELRQRQMERQQSLDDYNRRRADENADWKTHFDYTQANSPDAYETLLQAGGYKPGTPEYTAMMRQRAENEADPVVNTLQYGPMLRSQALRMGGGQPAAPGVTFTPLPGGPASQAPGGFPQ